MSCPAMHAACWSVSTMTGREQEILCCLCVKKADGKVFILQNLRFRHLLDQKAKLNAKNACDCISVCLCARCGYTRCRIARCCTISRYCAQTSRSHFKRESFCVIKYVVYAACGTVLSCSLTQKCILSWRLSFLAFMFLGILFCTYLAEVHHSKGSPKILLCSVCQSNTLKFPKSSHKNTDHRVDWWAGRTQDCSRLGINQN